MRIEYINIDSADDLFRCFKEKFSDSDPDSEWCFRGQADACWRLMSSVERYCEEFGFSHKKTPNVERFLIREFSRNVFAYAPELPLISNSQEIPLQEILDRKSTRLNSSHRVAS
jgi:hypothetical protein